jgi:hypothetical protein
MLNDLARLTRLSSFGQTLGSGLMFGAVFAIPGRHLALGLVLFGVGIVTTLGWMVGVIVVTRRADRALRAEIVRGSTEIVSGAVAATAVPARVVRRRIVRASPAFVLGRAEPQTGAAIVVVATALTDGAARRVAALVPSALGLQLRRGRPVALVLHPGLPDVAVVDAAADAEHLAAIEGLAVGLGVDWLVVQVFGG